MAATYRTQAVILRHEPYRDADRILTVLTDDHGVIRIRARGTRKSTSKLAGSIEPLTTTMLTVAVGRAMDILMGSEPIAWYPTIRADVLRYARASYATEAILQLLRHRQADRRTLQAFIRCLELLNDASLDGDAQQSIADAFVWKLIAWSGYKPELTHCVLDRRSVTRHDQLAMSFLSGGVVHAADRGVHDGRISWEELRELKRSLARPLHECPRTSESRPAIHHWVVRGLSATAEQPVRSEAFLACLLTQHA